MLKKILHLALALMPLFLWSQFNYTGEFEVLNLAPQIKLFEDTAGTATVEDILNNTEAYSFQEKENPVLNFGFTDSDFWLLIDIQNTTSNELILEFAGPLVEHLTLYKIENNTVKWTKESGYHIPVNEKTIKHHFQLFNLKDSVGQYLIKMSPSPQPVPVRLYSREAHEIKANNQKLIYGFYIGFMAFVVLSNLFFYYSLRSKLFLFYAGIALVYLSYSAFVIDGFIVYIIQDIDLNFWYTIIPPFGVIVQLIYGMIFLELRKYSAKHHRIISIIAGYFIIYFLVMFFLPSTVAHAINTLNAFISFFSMFFIGFITGKKGNRLGYYFAAAYFIYFVLVIVEGVYVQTGKPTYLLELSHVTWATLIEAFALSFLLSKRFEWEKEDVEVAKLTAQKELLAKTKENEQLVKVQNTVLEQKVAERTEELSNSYQNLKNTQQKLVQSEKLASLGELTAGIAHEIKNPLNFVNNFSELSKELIEEVNELSAKGDYVELKEVLKDLNVNMSKIAEHGKRADSIVKSMLMHSRTNSGEKERIDLNKMCEEYTKLAFHGFKAKDKSFTSDFKLTPNENLPKINVNSQELGRVVLNLVTNAFYAVSQKYQSLSKEEKSIYKPLVEVSTDLITSQNDTETNIQIRVSDNGTGVSEEAQKKVFQPFYTTKPAGSGTGLGLSLVFDIVKSLNGELTLESDENLGATFTINLPFSQLK